MGIFSIFQIEKNCDFCGNSFVSNRCNNRHFCSNKCRLSNLHQKHVKPKTGEIKNCLTCAKEFYVQKFRTKDKTRGKFCSVECYAKNKEITSRGDGNNQYIDGRSALTKNLYRTIEWRKLRVEIYKRDNFNCKVCHKHGGRLVAHHLIPAGICSDFYNPENLITVCHRCHELIHGKGV